MEAKNVPPGSRIIVDIGIKVSAWFLGTQYAFSDLLIGWKPGEDDGGLGWPSKANQHITTTMEKYGCNRGYWISIHHECEIVTIVMRSTTAISSGLACKVCGEFFPMAVPNRSDGKSLVCYSCRQGWISAGI